MDADEKKEADRRFKLDVRALALKFATEQMRLSFDKDRPPIYEPTIEAAKVYYEFLNEGSTNDATP